MAIPISSNNTNKLSPQEPNKLAPFKMAVQIIQINLALKNSPSFVVVTVTVQIIQINLALKNTVVFNVGCNSFK